MDFQFYIQDPLDPDTKYLVEALVEQLAAEEIERWRGLYSFATGDGVRNLFIEDPTVSEYINRARTEIVVGIDLVTNPSALEQLAELTAGIDRFSAQVFHSQGGTLFHPKVSAFYRNDGLATVVLGSGNLTPGGLEGNTEAFCVVTGTYEEMTTLTEWDAFIAAHSDRIGPIDDSAIDRARVNAAALRRRRVRRVAIEDEVEGLQDLAAETVDVVYRVLAAEVPRAGDRWHQVHFNADVVEQFIRMRADSEQRAFLRAVDPSGSVGVTEQRPLVFSKANRNFKIEMAARRDETYPDNGPPILVMKELGARVFHYLLLFPGEQGYDQVRHFIDNRPSVGRGSARVISNYPELMQAWPECPL